MASWAEIGGGPFFDAQDQKGLLAGIATALQAPWRILDRHGTIVATGVVGGSCAVLPPGTYRVEVLTDPLVTFEAVVLEPSGTVELTVGE